MSVHLRLAQLVRSTEAEGPGKRFAIWFQGCPFRCPGCCNPEMLSFSGGQLKTVEELAAEVGSATSSGIEGITLLGGEPFAHAEPASELAVAVQAQGLSVMVFSGYTLRELRDSEDPHVARLLAATDLLVDGLYQQDKPDTQRRWIGSTNQQVHFLTDRYTDDDEYWSQPDTLEIRLENGEITVNGFPAASAISFWKRPPTSRAKQR